MIPSLILLATERNPETQKPYAIEMQKGQSHLDWQIMQARAGKLRPLVILGQDGDEILRLSRQLMECDFVFDPNDGQNIFSALRAGLRATGASAFFLSVQYRQYGRELLWNHDETDPNSPFAQAHILTEAANVSDFGRHLGFITTKGMDFLTWKKEVSEPLQLMTCQLTRESIAPCNNPLISRLAG